MSLSNKKVQKRTIAISKELSDAQEFLAKACYTRELLPQNKERYLLDTQIVFVRSYIESLREDVKRKLEQKNKNQA